MLVLSKRNLEFSGPGGEIYLLKKDAFVSPPDWVTQTDFFKAYERAGLIAVSQSTKDSAVEKAIELADTAEKAAKEAEKAKNEAEKAKNEAEKPAEEQLKIQAEKAPQKKKKAKTKE